MKRLFILLIGSIGFIHIYGQEPVLYGERSLEIISDKETSRIFLDRNGDFYPEIIISDEKLSSSNAALITYFAKNPTAYKQVKNLYDLDTSKSKKRGYKALQDRIREFNLEQLSKRIDNETELYILIHGFRKPFGVVTNGTNSRQDFEVVKKAIKANRPDSKIHFLEVYWDGTYISVKPTIGGMIRLGKLFKNRAQSNATRVGVGLRKFIGQIGLPRLHIIAHSLGAQVVNNILWNANTTSILATPTQAIDVCLVAPAIARKPFRKFLNRNTDNAIVDSDNYNYSIIYNERDIVVAKSNFGNRRYFRFTRFFGNTKLGCNCSREAIKVSKMFNRKYPSSTVNLYDATSVGNNHRWGAYVLNPVFADYISSIE